MSVPGAIAVVALSLSALPSAMAGEVLTLNRVFGSVLEHFPRIQHATQEKLAREGRAVAALGAFDLALEQESLVWADGHYGGAGAAQRLVKPLATANAEVYGGYRLGTDDFPIYQQELVTNDGGEINLGLVLSLWRDRAIDERRFELASSRIGVQEADFDLLLAKVMTQRNAARAYWTWVAGGQRVGVYRRLVELAEQRMGGLERRAAAGDVARVQVVENRQNLLRRLALLTAAEQDFYSAAVDLSLFLRDGGGHPLIPPHDWLPPAFPPPAETPADNAGLIAAALARRPDLARIDAGLAREQDRLRLAENELLPRIDLGLRTAHDLGGGSRTRDGFDAIVDLTVAIPLERRRGRGLAAEARARLRQLELDRRLLEDQVANEIRKLSNGIAAAARFVTITRDEVDQATIIEEAERQRFAAGASDFFLVNLREERTVDARLRNLDAHLNYANSMNDYHAATVDLAALGL